MHEKIEQTLEDAIIEKVKAENLRNETKAIVMEREMMIESVWHFLPSFIFQGSWIGL